MPKKKKRWPIGVVLGIIATVVVVSLARRRRNY